MPPTNLRRAALVVPALALALVAGCASAPDQTVAAQSGADPGRGAAPSFDGPYAAELAEFYRSAENDFVLAVLSDGVITDAEYAEMTERFRSCLADQGVTFDGFRPDGGCTTSLAPGGAHTHEVVAACSRHSGQAP